MRILNRCVRFLPLIAILATTANAQVWVEGVDAGDITGSPFQNTVGDGPLTNIVGATGSGDFRDAYCITITDADAFYATTFSGFGSGTGDADFDTRLNLFELDRTGVMANDDHPGGAPFHSLISSRALWPGPGAYDPVVPSLVAGRQYLLAITGFNDEAEEAPGDLLFDLTGRGFADLWGDDAGGSGVLSGWSPGGAVGNYVIELGGASYSESVIPEPTSLSILAIGLAAGALRWRRRRV